MTKPSEVQAARNVTAGPDLRHPIGLQLWYFHKIHFQPVRRPRAAIISGPGDQPGHYNVHVFPDPLTDISDGKKPVMMICRNVPLLKAWPSALPEYGFLLEIPGPDKTPELPEDRSGPAPGVPATKDADLTDPPRHEPGSPEADAEERRHEVRTKEEPKAPPKKPAGPTPISAFLAHPTMGDYTRKLRDAGLTLQAQDTTLRVVNKAGVLVAEVQYSSPSPEEPGAYRLLAHRGGAGLEVILSEAVGPREVSRIMAHVGNIGVAAAGAETTELAGAATAKVLKKAKGAPE